MTQRHKKKYTKSSAFYEIKWLVLIHCLTKVEEDLPVSPLYGELVLAEKVLVLLLFDRCHDVLSFLHRQSTCFVQPHMSHD